MPAKASPAENAPEELLKFAEFLYADGEYYRAVTEYKRFIFAFPGHFRVPFAKLRIAEAYLSGGELGMAIEAAETMRRDHPLHPLEEEALFIQAQALIRSGRIEEGREMLRALASETGDENLREKALRALAASLIRGAEFESAVDLLGRIESMTAEPAGIKEARALAARADEIPHKSPLLAGSLGAVLPGAGHAYVGRKRTAVYAFLLTGLLVAASVEAFDQHEAGIGWGLAAMTALFHGGSVFSAVNTAHNYNQARLNRFEENILELMQGVGTGPAGSPGIEVSIGWEF